MDSGIDETSAILWPAHWGLALQSLVLKQGGNHCLPPLVTLLGTLLTGIFLRSDRHSIRMCCISTYDRIINPPKFITCSIYSVTFMKYFFWMTGFCFGSFLWPF